MVKVGLVPGGHEVRCETNASRPWRFRVPTEVAPDVAGTAALVPTKIAAANVTSAPPRGEMTRQIREASRRYWHADPLTPADGARLYSDFFSPAEFRRTGLYQELARPLGVEDMVRLWLDPRGAGGARLEFDRPDRRFRDSDRAVLDVLLPHLRQFRRSAVARRRSLSWPSNGAEGLTPREREILELVAQGLTNAQIARMLWISPGTVRKHLENAYGKLEVHTRTGAVAALSALRRGAWTQESE